MEEKKKPNGGLIAIIVILCLLVLGLGGYLIYDKVLSNKTEPINNNTNNTVSNTTTNKEDESVYKELGEKFINLSLEPGIPFFLDNKKYSDLSNETKLALAMGAVPESKIKEIDTPDSCLDGSSEEIDSDKCVSLKIDVKDFKDAYAKVFGQDKKIEQKTFNYFLSNCSFKNNEVQCVTTIGGYEGLPQAFYKYNKSEVDGNKLVLYYDSVTFMPEDEFYKDTACKDKLSIPKTVDVSTMTINGENFTNDNIIKAFGDKVGHYKVTFNKDNNGNWYWVSSSYIK